MAKGDVNNAVAAIASLGNQDFQPSTGVEVMVSTIHTESLVDAAVSVKVINGTDNGAIVWRTPLAMPINQNFKILITNTNYLRISNNTTASNDQGHTGIQTK